MVNHRGGAGNQNALNELRGISAYNKVVPEVRKTLIDDGIKALQKMTVSRVTKAIRGAVGLTAVGTIMGGMGFWPLLTVAPLAFVVLHTLRKDVKTEADLKSAVVEEIKEILADLNGMTEAEQKEWFENANAEAEKNKKLYTNATAKTPLPPAIPKPTHSKVANIPGLPQPHPSLLPTAAKSPSPSPQPAPPLLPPAAKSLPPLQPGQNPKHIKVSSILPPPAPLATGGRTSRKLGNKFNRCVKSVRSTVKARKGSNKESAAIAICTTSVLHPRGRTIKRYRKKRLITQKKFRGGGPWCS